MLSSQILHPTRTKIYAGLPGIRRHAHHSFSLLLRQRRSHCNVPCLHRCPNVNGGRWHLAPQPSHVGLCPLPNPCGSSQSKARIRGTPFDCEMFDKRSHVGNLQYRGMAQNVYSQGQLNVSRMSTICTSTSFNPHQYHFNISKTECADAEKGVGWKSDSMRLQEMMDRRLYEIAKILEGYQKRLDERDGKVNLTPHRSDGSLMHSDLLKCLFDQIRFRSID
jgi:hypothetical protein